MRSNQRTGDAATPGPRWRPSSSALPANPHVRTLRGTFSPDNVASNRLASQYGFTEDGEQSDDEDGLEIIYEIDAQRR